ncbi:protein-methionine-sulfoxide reductase heme-binding subunit MsrQ [Roseivivax sp. GX 12232]|uniref:protein-methionine-sulfoxide reductase heme-binding subunit MsrQ n=1 Tax=Roseivivax sp. GX 12232 TaxID=2900547 RepID=UPI001E51264B|nr:protein-methionine-sulfoxide reductase heme-binding subunit MsrQ [Roseivivax sp. GX 12232]MCE0507381.1 protein-methionine-sulfoxide reductase heme-binding subunit MsrQ [Roseivivax sp. GX 12232]
MALLRRLPVWVVYLLGALPAPYLFYLGLTGGLGVEPIEALEHEYGLIALQCLIAGLAITPLRRHLGVNLLKFRRALGLLAFLYLVLHLAVWAVLDVQMLSAVWADILKRPYITVGMAGFLLLLPLALTSNNLSVRRLGPRWRRLHRLVYPAVLLGALHFVMLRKGLQIEPLLYFAAVAGLLALRIPVRAGAREGRRGRAPQS